MMNNILISISNKKTREEIKNFVVETYPENRKNHTVEIAFWIIPISQSVAEIYGFKVSIAVDTARKL